MPSIVKFMTSVPSSVLIKSDPNPGVILSLPSFDEIISEPISPDIMSLDEVPVIFLPITSTKFCSAFSPSLSIADNLIVFDIGVEESD